VGGVKDIAVDIRLIAATNKFLRGEVEEGRFRNDLYYRLNVVNIQLPPLRDRKQDLKLLVSHFIEKYASERTAEEPILGLSPDVERLFYDYAWPGNVRELENAIERALVLCPRNRIRPEDLPRDFRENASNMIHLDGIPANATLYETLASVEKRMITRALKMTDNVQAHAAELLGIGKSGLNQKIKKYDIPVGSKE
jgi:two-component system NtrC family response regulator